MLKKYFRYSIAIIFTGIFSLSLHALINQYFTAPTLSIDPLLDQLANYAIRFGTIIGCLFIYVCSQAYWLQLNLLRRTILFSILMMALLEAFLRPPIMNIIVGVPWEHQLAPQLIKTIITYLQYLTLSFIICGFAHAVTARKQLRWLQYLLFSIFATAVFILVKMILQYATTPLLAYVSHPNAQIVLPPYGMDVLIPAYITFMEPTIAAFIVFYLIKNKLSAFNTLTKGFIMGGIIIVMHAGIYSILQIASSEGNIFYRIFYYGQFLWEYLALGLLTAYSFKANE